MSDKVVELINWVPRVGRKSSYIFVEGDIPNDTTNKTWRSSYIIKRYSETLLETKSSKYKLKGKIDRDKCKFLYYSPEFIKKFENGFPDDWSELLRSLHRLLTTPSEVFDTEDGRKKFVKHERTDNSVIKFTNHNENEESSNLLVDQGFTPIRPRVPSNKRNVIDSGSEPEENEVFEADIKRKVKLKKDKRKVKTVKSVTKIPTKPKKLLKLDQSEVNVTVDSLFEEPKPKTQRWNESDRLSFLKLLRFYQPNTENKWRTVIKSLRLDITVEECINFAKKFGWIHPDDKVGNEEEEHVPEIVAKPNMDMTIAEEGAIAARPGTAAHGIQMYKYNKNNQFNIPSTPVQSSQRSESMEDSVVIDKSLVKLLFTPEKMLPIPRMNFQVTTQLATPKTPSFDEESRTSITSSDSSILTEMKIERKIRHIHQANAKPKKKFGDSTNFTNKSHFIDEQPETTQFNFEELFNKNQAKKLDLLPEECEEEDNVFSDDSDIVEGFVDNECDLI